jgi:hypothetical protein
MLGASAAASHDSGQAAGVQEHRGKRKGHEGGSGVHQGEGKRAQGDKDTTTSGTSESGKRANTGSEGHQGGQPSGEIQGSACEGGKVYTRSDRGPTKKQRKSRRKRGRGTEGDE